MCGLKMTKSLYRLISTFVLRCRSCRAEWECCQESVSTIRW
ncbi:hypothetical protein Plhal304r1_c070g0158901 [Plasmopara halstedii]